ncbi:MAG: M15 family metallopeptidase [Planctomycetota bacterium]|nr:M15 family metallopeptidase [Planctomycetota bacterium]
MIRSHWIPCIHHREATERFQSPLGIHLGDPTDSSTYSGFKPFQEATLLGSTVEPVKTPTISGSVGRGGTNFKADVMLIQSLLNRVFSNRKLVVDGIAGSKTNSAIVQFQKRFLRSPDARIDPGGTTIRKLETKIAESVNTSVPVIEDAPLSNTLMKQAWPADTDAAITTFFGERDSNRSYLQLPYPMRLAWDLGTTVTRIQCNTKVVDSLGRILSAILEFYGSLEGVQEARMDRFAGCFAVRKMRGGTSWSRHSWGIAIDIDSEQNGLTTAWPSKATMPEDVIKIFEAEGWKSGARAWGRDAMHFQATH